jgi:hypothetical protein
MKVVRIEEAGPGLKVARDVVDLRGNLLYKAGTELTLDVIDKIRQRNVTHLFVDDLPGAPAAAIDIATRQAQVDADLDKTFADVAANPVMMALRESAKRYLKSKLK